MVGEVIKFRGIKAKLVKWRAGELGKRAGSLHEAPAAMVEVILWRKYLKPNGHAPNLS